MKTKNIQHSRLLPVLTFFFMSLSLPLTSCSDDQSDDNQGGKHIAEYTIMVYGCGGALDTYTIYDLFFPLMSGGSNDDVNITFLLKCSADFQTSEI